MRLGIRSPLEAVMLSQKEVGAKQEHPKFVAGNKAIANKTDSIFFFIKQIWEDRQIQKRKGLGFLL